MRLIIRIYFVISIFSTNCFSQSINLKGLWKVTCGVETLEDGSKTVCALCTLLQSDLPKNKNQFLLQVDTLNSTLILRKYGTTSGTTISYINYPHEKMLQFEYEKQLFVLNIITAGNTYILKDSNELCYLLLERLTP